MKKAYKLFIFLAALAVLVPVKAQSQSKMSVIESSFVSVGAGVNATVLHPTSPSTWGNVGLAVNLNVGTWFSSVVGARLGVQTGWNNCKQELNTLNVPAATPYGFTYYHADFLYGITNHILGTDYDRLLDVTLYANTGAVKLSKSRTFFAKGEKTWAYGVGAIGKINVSDEVSLQLDLQAVAANPSKYTTNGGRLVVFPTCTFGLCFNLGEIF